MSTCSTRNWKARLRWTRALSKFHAEGGSRRQAIEWLLARHGRRLPAVIRAGTEVMSRLDDDLFPEPVFVMTTCDHAPSLKMSPAERGIRLFSLIGLGSSF